MIWVLVMDKMRLMWTKLIGYDIYMNRKIICRYEGDNADYTFFVDDYPECCGVYGSLLRQSLNKKLVKFEVINIEE